MSTIDDLTAAQSAIPDPISAAATLTALLDLPSVGLAIRGARVVGRGSRASADLYLSDDTTITFESLRDVANPTRLAVEIAACTGATPRLKAPQAVKAIALLRALAEHQEVVSADALAVEWGATFLQAADVLDIDLGDQGQRWEAFKRLEAIEPGVRCRQEGVSVAKASLVLRDTDQTRLVRTGWFRSHVRSEDHLASPQEIAHQMERVGWKRPGGQGRIKATRPKLPGSLVWTFYAIPAGWEDER